MKASVSNKGIQRGAAPGNDSNEKSGKRPRCPRCGGYLAPDYELGRGVTSLRCIGCGRRIYREFRMRRPEAGEMAVNRSAGIAHHKGGAKRTTERSKA